MDKTKRKQPYAGIRKLCALIGLTLVLASLGWLAIHGVARLLFPITVVHTRDVAGIESKLRMTLGGVRNAEGYFVHAFREWVCWARFEAERDAFQSLLRENRMEDKIEAPWGTPERIRRHYGSPGVEGHEPDNWREWVVEDFHPEGEFHVPNSSIVFGSSKRQPKMVYAYVYGCPRGP